MSVKMTKQEFCDIIDEWISAPKSKWNHVTLVAYFYYKYKEKNGVHFTPTKWTGNPASSKECRDIKKVFDSFAPDYANLKADEKKELRVKTYIKIYNYINWMFDYKHRYGDKGKAVTTQFFLSPYAINEFQIMYNRALKKTESEDKIGTLLDWCKKEMPELLDSHQVFKADDLNLIQKYADMYSLEESSNERRLVKQAKVLGII